MGLLTAPTRTGLLSRRGGWFVVVAALHVGALFVLVHARIHANIEPEPVPIQVALLTSEQARESPPKPPEIEPPPPPEVQIPPIEVPVIEIVESRAITVTAVAAPPPPAPPPVAPEVDAPILLNVDQVGYLKQPAPRYPRAAKQARQQGTVLVWVRIDTEGKPLEVRVHRTSGHEELDREGCEAARHALFKPYRQGGVARSAAVIVPVEFMLTKRTASRG